MENLSTQFEEKHTTNEHQGSPADDKEPPIANSATSWIKLKTGSFLSSKQISDVEKEDVTLIAKPMKIAFLGALTMRRPSAEVMLVRVLLLVR